MFGHNKLHQCLLNIILYFRHQFYSEKKTDFKDFNIFSFNFNHICNLTPSKLKHKVQRLKKS